MSNSFDFGRWLYRYSLGLGRCIGAHNAQSGQLTISHPTPRGEGALVTEALLILLLHLLDPLSLHYP